MYIIHFSRPIQYITSVILVFFYSFSVPNETETLSQDFGTQVSCFFKFMHLDSFIASFEKIFVFTYLVCMYVCACQGTCVEVRRQLAVSSLPPLCGTQGLNSGNQARRQGLLPLFPWPSFITWSCQLTLNQLSHIIFLFCLTYLLYEIEQCPSWYTEILDRKD